MPSMVSLEECSLQVMYPLKNSIVLISTRSDPQWLLELMWLSICQTHQKVTRGYECNLNCLLWPFNLNCLLWSCTLNCDCNIVRQKWEYPLSFIVNSLKSNWHYIISLLVFHCYGLTMYASFSMVPMGVLNRVIWVCEWSSLCYKYDYRGWDLKNIQD